MEILITTVAVIAILYVISPTVRGEVTIAIDKLRAKIGK